jgi:hypothetical protein
VIASLNGLSDVLRDARFAMRSWTRQRSFTLTVLATLFVCLGGNTVIFSIVRSVALIATWLPARRAAGLNPAAALSD